MNERTVSDKRNQYFLTVLIGSCVCSLLQLAALPYNKTLLMSLTNRAILFLWFIGVGLALFKRLTKPIPSKSINMLLVLAFSALALVFALIKAPSHTIDYFLRVLGFLTLPIMISYSALFPMDSRTKKIIYFYNIAVSLLFVYLYHTDMRHVYEGPYGPVYLQEVTLGFANPNQTAMYLFVCEIVLLSSIFYFESQAAKLFLLADSAYILMMLVQTQSRTAILLIFTCIAWLLLGRTRRIPKSWLGIAIFIPVLYLLMIPILNLSQGNIEIMDADLFNGREAIFNRYWKNLNPLTFLFGDINRHKFTNMHNGYIAIAASGGIFTCLSYISLLLSHLSWNHPQKNTSASERIAYIGFLLIIVYTCSEAAFFVGGAHYAFLAFSIFALFAKPFDVAKP